MHRRGASTRPVVKIRTSTIVTLAAAMLTAFAAQAATVSTGDAIQGKRVISHLDVADLEPGRKHSFYFQGAQMATGQHWYVPVVVAKGEIPGKRILLISGVHGDDAGGNAPTRHAGLVFNRLFKPNADYVLDNHTSTTGTHITASIFAKMGRPEIRAMAELFPIEQIWNNPGYPGTLETALVDAGIPALPTEVGAARSFDRRMIPLFVEGSMNVLKRHGVVAGPMGRTSKEAGYLYRQRGAPGAGNARWLPGAEGRAAQQGGARPGRRNPAQLFR